MTSRNRDAAAYPTGDETALWVSLNLAQRRIFRVMDAALKAEGLPPLRWYDVLWALERDKGGGQRAFEMERSLLFEQSNLSRLLRRMIGAGLVAESVCPQDRRGKVLRITAEGRRVRKRMWRIYGPLIKRHMRAVALRDQRRAAKVLFSLTENGG